MKTIQPFRYLLAAFAMVVLAAPCSADDLKIHDAPDCLQKEQATTLA
jgi:hypothetical protein